MENTTAKVSLFARGYHYENNSVCIFSDTVAKQLLGREYDQIAQSMSQGISFFIPGFQGTSDEGLRLIVDNQLSPSVLGRSAFCEKMIENEVKDGCRQIVILASGYDTFAIRNSTRQLSVFELDLPEVVGDKKVKVENAGLQSCAEYVLCNLAESNWIDKLKDAGYNCKEKSFFSLLGISYYLTKDEFKVIMKSLGGMLSIGSGICFDFPSDDGGKEVKINQALASGAGEQMKAIYSYYELEDILKQFGFVVNERLGATEMTDQFFLEYNKSNSEHPMKAPNGVSYVFATRQ